MLPAGVWASWMQYQARLGGDEPPQPGNPVSTSRCQSGARSAGSSARSHGRRGGRTTQDVLQGSRPRSLHCPQPIGQRPGSRPPPPCTRGWQCRAGGHVASHPPPPNPAPTPPPPPPPLSPARRQGGSAAFGTGAGECQGRSRDGQAVECDPGGMQRKRENGHTTHSSQEVLRNSRRMTRD